MSRSAPFGSLALLALSGLAAAQAQVIVVDAASGPGTDFTDIGPAVAAASDHDTILVRAGAYAPFVVSGKSLVIVADTGALASIPGGATSTRIADLGASQSVVLRGLSFTSFSAGPPRLELDDNAGRVWIEDVLFGNSSIFNFSTTGQPAVTVTDTEDASFLHCEIYGGSGFGFVPGAPGIVVAASDVQMVGCTVRGGTGGVDVGAAGATLTSGELVVSGCTLHGGDGAQGDLCSFGAPGGPGLRLDAGQLWRIDTTIQGGRQGAPLESLCGGPGPHAPPILQNGGTIDSLPGAARRLVVDAPVREGEFATFTFEGIAGDYAYLAISLAQDPHLRLLFTGIQFLQEPFTLLVVAGTLTGSPATSQISLLVPHLAPPIEGWVVYAQAAFLNATPIGTPLMLGSASALTILDPAF